MLWKGGLESPHIRKTRYSHFVDGEHEVTFDVYPGIFFREENEDKLILAECEVEEEEGEAEHMIKGFIESFGEGVTASAVPETSVFFSNKKIDKMIKKGEVFGSHS